MAAPAATAVATRRLSRYLCLRHARLSLSPSNTVSILTTRDISTMASSTENNEVPWFLQLSYPVLFPSHEALTKPRAEFDAFIRHDLARRHDADVSSHAKVPAGTTAETVTSESSFTEVAPSTTGDIKDGVQVMDMDEPARQESSDPITEVQGPAEHPFMEGLLSHNKPQEPPNTENKMLTENADIAYQSTTNPLVDLFSELEDVITPPRLRELLEAAWNHDSQSTLKIIFNARSIHLGKSSKHIFYHCAGWLAQNHPLTLVANLQWLSRPVIPKKEKKDETEGNDVVMVEGEKNEHDPARYDVKHGVAHGYWKDLLNILALAANGKLDCLSDPRDILNSENPGIRKGKSLGFRKKKTKRARGMATARKDPSRGAPQSKDYSAEDTTPEDKSKQEAASEAENPEAEAAAKPSLTWQEKRVEVRTTRHQAAVKAFEENHVYRALHLTVARLFAEQLEADLKALRGDDPKAKRTISLCAKWAPTQAHCHDRHTFVVSSIAEIMYPRESLDGVLSPTDSHETYLRHARERYRKDTSPLRKHLEIVERDITAQTFNNIKYDRVPSVAMKNYSKLFAEKDFDRFEEYISRVAEGKANISGATLLPSTLIHEASKCIGVGNVTEQRKRSMNAAALMAHKNKELQSRVIDGQWKTLVQRIKDSGTLSSAIAVCDVSGSMTYPQFKDGTCPLDSSIGLSLLVASCTTPPFGGAFITFSGRPAVEKIDLSASLTDQIRHMQAADWQMNTNFVAVFEKLILPMARKNNLRPEDMVKRVFVFSDMQFDSAEDYRSSHWSRRDSEDGADERWSTSYERIKRRFEEAGYEMPELVFWNLAGGQDGMAPKPVTTMDEGTSLVSGYSQGMLKVFLDSGGFEEPQEEEVDDEESDAVMVEKGGDHGEEAVVKPAAKKAKMDPLRTVKKAIGHKSYEMLEVLD